MTRFLQGTLAVRELWLHPARSGLVLLALVLGTWGMGTPLISARILRHDLPANVQRTAPAHLVLLAEDFSGFDARDWPQVESATLRDFALERVEVAPDRWLPLYIFGVDSFDAQPLARLTPQRGAPVPPPGTVLVERNVLKVAPLDVGDSPRVRIDDHLTQVSISGVTFDAMQAPATQDAFVYAYADRPTWAALTGKTSGQRLLLRLVDVHSADDVRHVADTLVKELAAAGVQVTGREVPRFEEHPHQWQLDTLLFLVTAIGALAFAMAAVLVSQLMRAILAGQVRQIGVLKAIGANRWQVLRVSALTALALGGLATAIGVPLAAESGRAFSSFVAQTLNFDLLTPGVPLDTLLVLAAAGLRMPLLFSLHTLVRGSALTVNEALGHVRASPPGSKFGSRLSPGWRMAVRNVWRDRTRLGVTVSSMGLGVAIFATGFNVRQSLWQLLENVSRENRYDVQVVLGKPVDRSVALAPFATIPRVERVELWTGGQGEVQSRVLATQEGVGVVALPRDTPLLELTLTEGRWLRPSDSIEAVLNQQAWLRYGQPALGSRFDLVVGQRRAPAVFVGLARQFERSKVYVDQADFDAQFDPEHRVTTLLFVAEDDDYDDVLALKKALEHAVAASDLPVLYVMSHAERVRIIYEHLDIVLAALLLLSFLVLVVSAIGNAAAASVDVLQRTRELGVLRAIGATPRAITLLLRREGLVMSALGILFGLLLALPLTDRATRFFGDLMLGEGMPLPPAVSLGGLGITVAVTFVFGLIASWLPARSALRVPTQEALQHP